MDFIKKNTAFIGTHSSSLMSNNSPIAMVIKVSIVILSIMFLVYLGKKIVTKYKDYKSSKLWILSGTKSAKKRMVILQDPSKHDSLTLKRSKNEEDGLEFSYFFWMHIDDWSYRQGEWKHVMHKGNESGWPLRAPGVWLHPKDNKLRVYMNTFKKIDEFVDVDNIPLNKWFNVAICMKQQILDVYINGNVVKSKKLDGLPKQNYGDLYINAFQGFSGYMSNIRYYDYYMSYSELSSNLGIGPSMMPIADTQQMPPYLTPNWWTNN